MKCPCCKIEIEDEGLQVSHVERCHPELLRKRWEDERVFSKEEIETNLQQIAEKYPSLDELVKQCWDKVCSMHIIITPGVDVSVLLSPHGKKVICAIGETIVAALNLAIDRMEYGNGRHCPICHFDLGKNNFCPRCANLIP